jgi:capsular exopolysaccharide synthesis family protein
VTKLAPHIGNARPPLEPGEPSASPVLRGYLQVLARRKFPVLLSLLLVPTVVVVVSVTQQPLYQGSAEVLLSHPNLATGLTGIPDSSVLQPDRVAKTQANLARVPTVAERTLRAAALRGRTVDDFLKASSVTAQINSDLLRFTVTDPDPKLASSLASTYAREYTAYRRGLDTAAIQRARRDLEKRIQALEASNGGRGSLYESLVANEDKLRTMEALLTSNASVVRENEASVKIRPQPKRAAILALALGLVLGVGLAFLAEAIDTRVRLVDEIGQRLGLPLLARMPERKSRRRRASFLAQEAQSPAPSSRLVMLEDPTSFEAEGYRVLRANFDFLNVEGRAQSIMVTSALEGEGKSETIANLALALARSGRRVALVDLDLRRPTLHRLFELSGSYGVVDVAAGDVELDQALVRVPLERRSNDFRIAEENSHGRSDFLEVLPAGSVLPDAGEFVGTQALGQILRDLRHRADLVLVDAPALLRVGDAMALSAQVDALLVVVRFNAIRRPILKELRRVLDACPAPKLGVVITHADNELGYGYAEIESRQSEESRAGVRLPGRLAVAEGREVSE